MQTPIQSSEATTYLPAPSGPYVVSPNVGDGAVDLSLVLPTYREGRTIQKLLQGVCNTLRSVDGLRFEVIVVDDNSPDGTAALAVEQRLLGLHEVKVIHRSAESGLATAVIRGWQAAQGRILAVMDADFQHPPPVLLRLLQAIQTGADLSIASRHVQEGGVSDWSLFRRIISRTAQLIGLVLLPDVVGRVSDPMSGYFMLDRRTIAGKALNPTGYKILIEILARGSAIKISEVGYVFQERLSGESKVTGAIYLQYLQHLCRLRATLLLHSRFARFCLVGMSGVAVDMALLFALSDPHTLHWGLTRSKLIAAEVAIVNNFLWNDAWTFADLASRGHKMHRFLKFNVICTMGLMLNVVLLNIQFNWLGIDRYVANAISILSATIWNYLLNKHLGWRSSADPT